MQHTGSTVRYPLTRTTADVDVAGGLSFPDPYRWLEDGLSADVRGWQREQNDLVDTSLSQWPHVAQLEQSVRELMGPSLGALPVEAGGCWFRTEPRAESASSVLVVADEPYGEGSVLLDAPLLSWFAPSPDGRMVAAGVCVDGSERNTIRLVDVSNGELLPDAPPHILPDALSGGVWWLPDATGFCFAAPPTGSAAFDSQVFLHLLKPGSTTRLDVPWTTNDYRFVRPSRDGRRLVALERMLDPVPVAVADLVQPADLRWRPFVTRTDCFLAGHLVDDTFVGITDLDAPRGRVVAVHVDRPEAEHWQTLVPESDAVLRRLTLAGDAFYLSELVDTYSRVRLLGLDGTPRGEVPLPDRGAVHEQPYLFLNLAQRPHQDDFVFAFSSLRSSVGVHRHRRAQPDLETLLPPAVVLDEIVVEDHSATSADGTRVPYQLVRRRDVDPSRPQPTLVYGYGAYNTALLPSYPATMVAYVVAGGSYVHAHLRGGGELGREWWEGGRFRNKQNSYDDLYAIVEQLVADNRTRPDLLALTGGSNGGLMAGVAVSQRPELWGAVVPQVPQLDMIGSLRDPYGRVVVEKEYADVSDASEVARLATFSPYHLVEERDYPAVLVVCGDTDPRCPAWHGRKFVARMQAAQQGAAPILLRVHGGGHGLASSRDDIVRQATEVLAFVMQHVGPAAPIGRPS